MSKMSKWKKNFIRPLERLETRAVPAVMAGFSGPSNAPFYFDITWAPTDSGDNGTTGVSISLTTQVSSPVHVQYDVRIDPDGPGPIAPSTQSFSFTQDALTVYLNGNPATNFQGIRVTAPTGGAPAGYPAGSLDNFMSASGVSNYNVFLIGNEGNDTLITGQLNDTLDGGNGNDVITADNRDVVLPGDGNDTINFGGSAPGVVFTNTGNGNDSITGSSGNDTIGGGGGNDTIVGGGGNDSVSGGDGNDSVVTGNGNDTVDGGNGNDSISTGDGNDIVSGGDGNDTVDTGNGNDSLSGGNGNDSLVGGLGNDTYNGGAGFDTFNDAGGIDTLNYGDETADLTIFLGPGPFGTIVQANGNNVDFFQTETGGSFENVIGGSGNDFIIDANPSGPPSVIDGGNGNDTIFGMGGDDVLTGGNGDDYIDGGVGNDSVTGGNGNDTVLGGAGNDVLQGNDGDDYMEGGQGADSALGGNGNDTIEGGLGNDTLQGNDGNDIVNGGDGADTLFGDNPGAYGTTGGTSAGSTGEGVFTATGNGNDTITGGSGADTIDAGNGNDFVDGGFDADTLFLNFNELSSGDNYFGGQAGDAFRVRNAYSSILLPSSGTQTRFWFLDNATKVPAIQTYINTISDANQSDIDMDQDMIVYEPPTASGGTGVPASRLL